MIAELKEVIARVEQLDNEEQKQIARLIENELRWEASFQKSEDKLVELAEEALNEHKAGKTKQADW